MNMKLRRISGSRRGETFEYAPWDFEWQGMQEEERIAKGIFVKCYGHGEFDVYILGKDVEIVAENETR
jgi:hypothetical protein